jgi:hypothetical protein
MATIPLPTGSYQTADTRASNKRLVNCMSEIAPQTSSADLKSLVPPCYLRRMFGISPYANGSVPNPSLLLHMDGVVPTIPVSLLLHMDGANGSTAFVDSSVNAFAMTAVGGAQLTTTAPEFGTACGTFNGTTSYVNTPFVNGGPLDLGLGDFTIEMWVNPAPGATAAAPFNLISWSVPAANPVLVFDLQDSTGVECLNASFNGTQLGKSGLITPNTWNAVALVVASNVMTAYLNGVAVGSSMAVSGRTAMASANVTIGALNFLTTSFGNFYQGKIDEVRVTKGVAIYTSNYTPVGPLSAQVVVPPAPAFIDSSLNAFPMTSVGGAAITPVNPKFGNGDGTFPSTTFGSAVTTPITANGPLDIFGPVSGGDFTIQGWFMAPAFAQPFVILDYGDTSGSSANGVVVEVNSATQISVTPTVAGWSSFSNGGSVALTPGIWNFFALVRTGSTAVLYLNGAALPNTATNWTSSSLSPGRITVGASPTITGTSQPFFLDEMVVYPAALYATNFTPALTATIDPVMGAASPAVRGMWDMLGVTYVVIGPSLFTLSSLGVLTFLATGIAGNGFVRMTDNTACLVIVVPGTLVAYTYTILNGFQQLLTGPITQFGAIDCWFVDSFIVFLALNGREFYNDDGQTASGQGQITFNTGGVFPREFGTDPFVGMAVDHRTVLMFGTRTSEAYVDTGNSTESPFSSAPDGFMQIGCHPQAGYTVALQDQSVFWVANDLTVRRRNGQTPVRVSNSGIEAVLEANKENLNGCFAMVTTIGGHPLWILNIPLASRTLVYDCLTTEWFELESLVNSLGYWRPLCLYNAQGLQLVGDSQSSQIGFLDATTFTEFANPMRARITTQSIYDKHNRITTNRVEAVITCGEGSSLTRGAQITLYKSKDSGATYTARQTKSLGASGQRQARAFWTKLGQQRDLALMFQISDPTPTFAVDIQADVVGGKW